MVCKAQESQLWLPGRLIALPVFWLLFATPWLMLWLILGDLSGWPSNDDPFYAKPIQIWSETGNWQWVRQSGELTASSAAHVVLGAVTVLFAPFSYRSLYLICILQQSLAAAVLWQGVRTLNGSVGLSCLCAVTFALHPIYFGHAFTYMTDGPATAWSAIAGTCFIVGCCRNSKSALLCGSLCVGLGYWMRQTNGMLLLIPLIAAIASYRRPQSAAFVNAKFENTRWSLAMIAAAFLPALIAITVLECGSVLPTSLSRSSAIAPSASEQPLKRVVIGIYGCCLLFGWLLAPLLLCAWSALRANFKGNDQSQSSRRYGLVALALVLLAGMAPLLITRGGSCITNATGVFVQNGHFGPIFLSDMDEAGRWGTLDGVAWPMFLWQLLSIVAILTLAIFVGLFSTSVFSMIPSIRKVSCTTRQIAIVAILATIVTAVAAIAVFVEPHMDRYWMFLWPLAILGVALLAIENQWRISISSIVFCALFCLLNYGMSVVFTHDMLAWNDARWRYVRSTITDSFPAQSLDAGRDVNAWYRMDEDPDTMPREGDTQPWWSGLATTSIATGDRPGWKISGRLPWYSWATCKVHHLFILEKLPKHQAESYQATDFVHSFHSFDPNP